MREDPITLIIAPDREGKAAGRLYLDDGKSFDYKTGVHLYMEFTYQAGKLQSKMLSKPGNLIMFCNFTALKLFCVAGLETPVWLYKVKILGSDSSTVSTSGQARLMTGEGESSLDTSFSHSEGVTTVRRPGVALHTEWTIQL